MQAARPQVLIEGFYGYTLRCQSLTCEGLGFNSRYTFTLKANIKRYLDPTIFSNARITFSSNGVDVRYFGELLWFEIQDQAVLGARVTFHFGCSLHRLDNACNEQLYISQRLEDILTQLLTLHKIRPVFQLKNKYARIPYTAQGGVSDYDYLCQLCADHGVVFYYRQEHYETKLYFTDKTYQTNQHTLVYNQKNGLVDNQRMISHLRHTKAMLPENIRLRGASEDNPDVIWESCTSNQTDIAGIGMVNMHAYGLASNAECDKRAQHLQQQLDWQREWFQIETSGVAFQPGDTVVIQGHSNPRTKTPLRVISVSSSIEEEGKTTSHPYRQHAILIPVERPYAMPTQNTTLAWDKTISGDLPACLQFSVTHATPCLQTALISGENEERMIDEQGRYCIHPLFDKTQRAPGRSSHRVRQLQPGGGAKGGGGAQGVYLPLGANTRVIIAHLNNQVNKPFILGVLPGEDQPDVGHAKNRHQLAIHHKHGSAFVISDTEHKQQLKLHTKDNNHGLTLYKDEEKELITLKSVGRMTINAQKEMDISSGRVLNVDAESSKWNVGDDLTIWVKKKLAIRAGDNLSYRMDNDWLSLCERGLFKLGGKQTLVTQGKSVILQPKKLHINSQSARITAHQAVTLKAKQKMALNVGCNQLVLSNGCIELKSASLKLFAAHILKNIS